MTRAGPGEVLVVRGRAARQDGGLGRADPGEGASFEGAGAAGVDVQHDALEAEDLLHGLRDALLEFRQDAQRTHLDGAEQQALEQPVASERLLRVAPAAQLVDERREHERAEQPQSGQVQHRGREVAGQERPARVAAEKPAEDGGHEEGNQRECAARRSPRRRTARTPARPAPRRRGPPAKAPPRRWHRHGAGVSLTEHLQQRRRRDRQADETQPPPRRVATVGHAEVGCVADRQPDGEAYQVHLTPLAAPPRRPAPEQSAHVLEQPRDREGLAHVEVGPGGVHRLPGRLVRARGQRDHDGVA